MIIRARDDIVGQIEANVRVKSEYKEIKMQLLMATTTYAVEFNSC